MRRNTALSTVIASVCLAVLPACSAPGPGPRVTPASVTPYSEAPTESAPSAREALSLGAAPADLRDMDWEHARIPGDFCDIPGTVTLGPETEAESCTWGTVHVGRVGDEVSYGDITGDGRDEAALYVVCDNRGGTAAGQLAFAFVVLGREAGRLTSLGATTPQHNPPDQHATLLGSVDLAPGKVTVGELWYRESDANCSPSGTAETEWTVGKDRKLVAGSPRITS